MVAAPRRSLTRRTGGPGTEGAPPHADPDGGAPVGNVLRALAVVGPPVTIATALLFYFGWALTEEQSKAMGLNESIFVMTTRDYTLRSVDALYLPLIVGSALLLLWVVVHGWLIDLASNPRTSAAVGWFGRGLAWSAWWCVPAAGLLFAQVWPAWGELVVPLSLALGFLLAEYGTRIRDLADDTLGRPTRDRPAWTGYLRSVLIGVLVTAALFWAVANYAGVVGRGKAELVASQADQNPTVTVYSQHDLHVAVDGVENTVFEGTDSDYRYRYSGLRLLQRSGDRLFLVPPGWAPGRSPLVVLRDDGSIRFEFTGS